MMLEFSNHLLVLSMSREEKVNEKASLLENATEQSREVRNFTIQSLHIVTTF